MGSRGRFRYVDAREARDPKAIESLFTADADQLVSDGTWRHGRDELVKGMLESSRRNPARRQTFRKRLGTRKRNRWRVSLRQRRKTRRRPTPASPSRFV